MFDASRHLNMTFFSKVSSVALTIFPAVSGLRTFVTVSNHEDPGSNQGSVHVRFVVHLVAPGQVYPHIRRFSPIRIIPSKLYTHPGLNISLTIKSEKSEAWDSSKKQCALGNREALDRNELLNAAFPILLEPIQLLAPLLMK